MLLVMNSVHTCLALFVFFFSETFHSGRAHSFFFFNDTATTEIYTLSLHDALPIFKDPTVKQTVAGYYKRAWKENALPGYRSEEHTSELQSQSNLVCRLLLEKKKYMSSREIVSMWRLLGPGLTRLVLSIVCIDPTEK